MTDKEEFKHILDITCKAFNVTKEDIMTKSRKMDLAIARQVAAVIGIKDANIKRDIVAKEINRDRTGMYYYEKKHKEYFDWFQPYRKGYIKVLKEYKNINADKKQFISKAEFNMFIKGIKLNKFTKPDIIITVKYNKYRHDFLSNVFNFTNDMEILKTAFKDYKIKYNYKTYEE